MFTFFGRGSAVSTNPDKIQELLTRGVMNVYPSTDFLKDRLLSGERLTLYLGIDPTAPTLHLGHLIPLRKMRQFQELGHQVILLVGDFTGMIGDPTDKSATRKRLTRAEVLENAKQYQKQAGILIRFSGSNPALLKYNSEWLSPMKFDEVLELSSHFTVQQMLERDMFAKRAEEGKPIYLHEFLYPLLQGYDSVAMNVDGEIGGNDQTFNMLTGRTLLKQIKNKEKFVITTKLLEDETGKKMGKSEGNMLSLRDSASEMYGKVMSWSDGMVIPAFELCTAVPLSEIESIKNGLSAGGNPKDAKVRLAKEIVSMFHGASAADTASQNFGSAPADLNEVNVASGSRLDDALLRSGVVKSKSELRRLISAGAVSDAESGLPLNSIEDLLTHDQTIKVGKHRFVKIKISTQG